MSSLTSRHRAAWLWDSAGVSSRWVVLTLFTVSLSLSTAHTATVSITGGQDTTSPSLNSTKPAEVKQGWTSQPNQRGSVDIIWSCVLTIVLSSWSVLCLNLPEPDDTPFRNFRRKVYVTALGFLGPEFIFQMALGQWISARRSVQDFHASGYLQWTMNHAFFADMGGLVLHTRDWTPFPIDAKQLHYLVAQGYVDFPRLDKQRIADKNKVDGLLRLLTLCQTLWFTINVVARAVQGLAITCGELTTAAFLVCTLGTTLCWLHKPADVTTADIVTTNASIADILLKAGDQAQHPYYRTPLDFVSRKEWPWSLYWANWVNILRHMGIVFESQSRPKTRFEDTDVHELPSSAVWVFLAVTATYSAVFLSGWNFAFPTLVEQTLWRAASLTMVSSLVTYWSVTEFAFSVYPALRRHLSGRLGGQVDSEAAGPTRAWVGQGRVARTVKAMAASCRNNSVSQDPALSVPLKAILPTYVIGVFYCSARAYIFLADIIALRSLPASAYVQVNWSQFFPHF